MFRNAVLVGRWLGVAALVILTVIVAAEILARSLFNYSMEFIEELSGFLLVAITFLAVADSFSSGKFMRVDVLHSKLTARRRDALDRVQAALAGLFCTGLCFYAASLVKSSYANGVVSTGLGALPVWIPQCVLFLGTCFLAVACFRRALLPGGAKDDQMSPDHFE